MRIRARMRIGMEVTVIKTLHFVALLLWTPTGETIIGARHKRQCEIQRIGLFRSISLEQEQEA